MNEHWDLTKIYENEELWEKDIAFCQSEMIPALRELEGHLGEKEGFKKFFVIQNIRFSPEKERANMSG